MIRTTSSLIVAAIILSGCSAKTFYGFSKSGVDHATVSHDATACSVEANRLFPAAVTTTSVYGGYGGGGYGGYGHYGGWGASQVQFSDANASMRAEHNRDCMALKGYQSAPHPICTKDQLAGRNYQAIDGAPRPAPTICALKVEGGGRTLVDLTAPL